MHRQTLYGLLGSARANEPTNYVSNCIIGHTAGAKCFGHSTVQAASPIDNVPFPGTCDGDRLPLDRRFARPGQGHPTTATRSHRDGLSVAAASGLVPAVSAAKHSQMSRQA